MKLPMELRKDRELHLVQCKRWRTRKVGVGIVRELLWCNDTTKRGTNAGKKFWGCSSW